MQRRGRVSVIVPRTRANRSEIILHRGEITGRYKGGQSLKEISREMGIHIKSVRLCVRRYEAEGHVETRPRLGGPRVTTPYDDKRIIAASAQSQENGHNINKELGLECHVTTTLRRLHEAGILYTAIFRPLRKT
ncbi:hypothetical protein Pcinc_017918 [Petrolisthes cinctipes]|uniref:Insertion element IS150 protein InsJ-like helix-turn-helix domain-containing protein n=1 Tax=Petrolisthes cinctipes TaxID=88211 RepID=A0AAE1FN90_PETCI|nr:hypothetical protein Pcinc_017918 [Petrolisthes cinctipes]